MKNSIFGNIHRGRSLKYSRAAITAVLILDFNTRCTVFDHFPSLRYYIFLITAEFFAGFPCHGVFSNFSIFPLTITPSFFLYYTALCRSLRHCVGKINVCISCTRCFLLKKDCSCETCMLRIKREKRKQQLS